MDERDFENTNTREKKSSSRERFIGPLDLSYDEIPIYRRRWFAVLLMGLFLPAVIIIHFTGDIYALRDKKVYKYPDHSLGKFALILLIAGIIQLILIV